MTKLQQNKLKIGTDKITLMNSTVSRFIHSSVQ